MTKLELTQSENDAKQYLIRIVYEGTHKPCDIGDEQCSNATLPVWYNETKYKRGQKYFFDNRFGMLGSNMCGLLTLLAEPKGLKILSSTGRSSTPETARKRYASTILHLLTWYETDLSPGSKSWISLNRVRKMHFSASNTAKAKNIGYITQAEISLTTFGFMGFALIRPHLLGIAHDNDDDREAFIHFWAVMGHMLGVQDEYNMCLYSIETVSIICQMLLRYIFMPLIQFDTPEFRRMVDALFEGMKQFLPHMTYDIQMFTVKRVIGIPGYQYNVDAEKETLCRRIFENDELTKLRSEVFKHTDYEYNDVAFNECVPLLEIRRRSDMNGTNGRITKQSIEINLDNMDENRNVNGTYVKLDEKYGETSKWHKMLGLESHDQLVVTILEPEEWNKYLNDSKFYSLSLHDQYIVKIRCGMTHWLNYRIGRFFLESGLSVMLYFMRKWYVSKRGQAAVI